MIPRRAKLGLPVFLWMPLLLGFIALLTWIFKNNSHVKMVHPRSARSFPSQTYEVKEVNDLSAADIKEMADVIQPGNGDSTKSTWNGQASDEVRLVDHLLSHYKQHGKIARPLRDSSKKINVYFGLRLIMFDISEKEQTMKTSVWVRMMWRDEYLQWNTTEFGNIRKTILPWDNVWTPDIALVNTAETDVDIRQADLMVDYTGNVYFTPHCVFTSACLIDVTLFPFDNHTCDMWFQAMSRYENQMDLLLYEVNNPAFDIATYIESFEKSMAWEITSATAKRHADAGIAVKFSKRVSLKFEVHIKRRPAYMEMLLLVPCVVLGCCTLVVFCLPPDRPDRINLAMSLLSSFFVLVLILVETAPPSAAAVPLLAKYYACVAFLIMASPFLSGLVVNISRRGEGRLPPPRFIQTLCLEGLTWPLNLHDRWRYILEVSNIPREQNSRRSLLPITRQFTLRAQHSADLVSQASVDNAIGMDTIHDESNSRPEEHVRSETVCCNDQQVNMNGIQRRLDRIESVLTTNSAINSNQSNNADAMFKRVLNDPVRLQWRLLSRVLDRLCFCIYFIIIVFAYAFFFPKPR